MPLNTSFIPVRVNLCVRSISVRSLIESGLYKLIPCRILNALSQTMIANHAFDVQIFKGQQAEHGDERIAKLMSKVAASEFDSFVNACGNLVLLLPLRF